MWTLNGGTMNLFYNGFRAVLPWVGVMFFGMWIGRFDLRNSKVRKSIHGVGPDRLGNCRVAFVWFALLQMLTPYTPQSEHETLVALFGTDSLPAMPLFLFSSGGFAIAVIHDLC